MKRDIKVNYGTLDEIVNKLRRYKNALNSMERSLDNMNSKIENENKGESVRALIYKYKEIKRQIKSCEREIDDLYNIFRSYISDMTSIIRPVSYHQMMRVSRNDIYWNMKEIFGCVDKVGRLRSKSLFGNVTNPFNDDEKKKNEEENAKNLKQAVKDIEQCYNKLKSGKYSMERLYNRKVIPYENMDDTYKSKAKNIYYRYSNAGEQIKTFLGNLGSGIKNLAEGFIKGFSSTVYSGIVGIVFLVGGLVGHGCNLVFGDSPDFLKPCEDGVSNFVQGVKDFIHDPTTLIDNIGQSVNDTYEEKGLAYMTGSLLGDAAGMYALGKAGDLGKGKFDDIKFNFQSGKILYEDLEKLSGEEQIKMFSKMNGRNVYNLIDNGPDNISWITKGYDLITPKNVKDFVKVYTNTAGDISLNLEWPIYGGYKPETISSIKDLKGKIPVSRDGGDGGYTMGIGRNVDGTYSNNSQRAIPKSSAEVNTGVFDADLYKNTVDIITREYDDFTKIDKLIDIGIDEEVASDLIKDYKNWLTRPEIVGDNSISDGLASVGKNIENKYGYYGNAEEWIVGDVRMSGGAGQMNTVYSWGKLKESGIIFDIGRAKIN